MSNYWGKQRSFGNCCWRHYSCHIVTATRTNWPRDLVTEHLQEASGYTPGKRFTGPIEIWVVGRH